MSWGLPAAIWPPPDGLFLLSQVPCQFFHSISIH